MKAGLDPDSASSYRPISNLTFLFKLMERLVCCQLNAYLHQYRLLASLQSAYRKHHSTETATLKIASDVFDAVDAENVTVLALLDFSAASTQSIITFCCSDSATLSALVALSCADINHFSPTASKSLTSLDRYLISHH